MSYAHNGQSIYQITNPDHVETLMKILNILHADTPSVRRENWLNPDKISDTDVDDLKIMLGMTPTGNISPDFSTPSSKNTVVFSSTKEAYPCSGGAQITVTYNSDNKASYTEYWPWA